MRTEEEHTSVIELRQVTKKYGSLTALRGISFRIRKGETVGLLGRNGAGKTTLLNLLTGYFPPTEGRILIGGTDLAEQPAACKRKIGYLPEKPPLYDEMTTESYLRFVCELREVRKAGIRDHVEEIIGLCGLQEARGRVLGHLSKGTRQRAGIAQALCGAPELLILDEPTVGLDPKQTTEIRELIRALSREHTVLFSSHILSEVQQACSRVLILEEGELVTDYDAREPESGGIRLRLSIAGEAEQVMQTLRGLPGFSGAEALPGQERGITEAAVPLSQDGGRGETLDRAFRVLADSGLRVRGMREEREDLEAVFLRAVRRE